MMSEQKMIVFWKYDQFPGCLHGELAGEFGCGGRVYVKGYDTMSFKPLAILPPTHGREVAAALDKLQREYKAQAKRHLLEYQAAAHKIADFLPAPKRGERG
jgi:hypothetical protein